MQISWPKTKLMTITPTPPTICHWRYATRKYGYLLVDSFTYMILDPWSRMMALPLLTSHLALQRLPLPCVAYQIHSFANTASAYEPISTCSAPWLSPSCSMTLKHGPPPSSIAAALTCSTWCAVKCAYSYSVCSSSSTSGTKASVNAPSNQPQHPFDDNAAYSVRASPPHASLTSTLTSMVGKDQDRGRPKTRWPDSIKHDPHSAGLDNNNAAQMVFDRSQMKAFACGLPTLELNPKSSKSIILPSYER